jgi:hypothetical protein
MNETIERSELKIDREQLNAHYGMANERFDRRAGQLITLGFRYQHIEECNITVFTRKMLGFKKPDTIAASFVLYADEIFWLDRLADAASVS